MASRASSFKRISDSKALNEGLAWLSEREPRFAYALQRIPAPKVRLREDGFPALLRNIVSQQVSTAAASAILARVEQAGLSEQTAIRAADEDSLRALGVSRQKARYLKAIADANLDYAALRSAPTEQVIATLVTLKGVGVWTAEIYAMFALGRADAFPAGDLGLQQGARLLFDLPKKPSERALRERASAWSPWRSAAARILWSYYDTVKTEAGR